MREGSLQAQGRSRTALPGQGRRENHHDHVLARVLLGKVAVCLQLPRERKLLRQGEEEKGESKLAVCTVCVCNCSSCRHHGNRCLQAWVRGGLVCGVQGLEVRCMLLQVTVSRSGAGTSPLHTRDSAVRQWQVGCGIPQPSLLERSIFSIIANQG